MLMRLYGSTIGKKTVMALTGAFMLLFVGGHMFGNFKIYLGADALNHYAEGLKTIGEPFLPETWFLWLFRGLLLVAFVLHVFTALQLAHKASASRRESYKMKTDVQASVPSKLMVVSGIVILVYLLGHLAHLTFGVGISGFDMARKEVFNNVVLAFTDPIASAIYIVAMVFLGMHIFHGTWSMFQTLGLNNVTWTDVWRGLAWAAVVLIAGINITFPIYVMVAQPAVVTTAFETTLRWLGL